MGYFLASDDIPLYFTGEPDVASKAAIVFLHGLGEHIGRYEAVFEDFSGQGYGCFGFDQRGFGRSGGERGHVDSFSRYVEDLTIFINWVSAEMPGKPILLFGHSMGSIVVLSYALQRSPVIRGLLVFSCPLLLAQWTGRVFGSLVGPLSAFFPRLKIPNLIDPDELSDDPEVIKAFKRDRYVEKSVSLSWLREFKGACDNLCQNASQIVIPVLMTHGSQDRIADIAGVKLLFEKLGSKDKMLDIYEGLKHELLNHRPSERKQVLEKTFNWLGQHC
jgi:alpha-beta hydrolase superfamily lysophospholipase